MVVLRSWRGPVVVLELDVSFPPEDQSQKAGSAEPTALTWHGASAADTLWPWLSFLPNRSYLVLSCGCTESVSAQFKHVTPFPPLQSLSHP